MDVVLRDLTSRNGLEITDLELVQSSELQDNACAPCEPPLPVIHLLGMDDTHGCPAERNGA